MTHNLAVPTIHLNGTSKESLLEAISNARLALRDALESLGHTAPNGRDFYVQGPNALHRADVEYRARAMAVLKAHDELGEIALAIDEQSRGR
jgi:hypothetical protein